jgi:hypothetical protein
VQNIAQLKYSMMKTDIRALQHSLETKGLQLQAKLFMSADNTNASALIDAHAGAVLDSWWKLADMLMVKYADGYVNTGATTAGGVGVPTG